VLHLALAQLDELLDDLGLAGVREAIRRGVAIGLRFRAVAVEAGIEACRL
jgi:hypothetical protein